MQLFELAKQLEAELFNAKDIDILKFSSLETAERNHLSFATPKVLKRKPTIKAGALLVAEVPEHITDNIAFLKVSNLDFARLQAIHLLHPTSRDYIGVHPSAVIDSDCQIDESCSISPGVVLAKGVKIAANTQIGANSVIEKNVTIGSNCKIASNVTIGWGCILGNNVNIDSGTVIGSNGFGLVKKDNIWHEIPQIGRVVIGDNVLIGSNCSIDRGALDDTVIHEGAKLDNLVHVAHNVEIGKNSIMAGHTAIAGSAKLGNDCAVLGTSGIASHVKIADNTLINSMTAVTSNINQSGGSYTGMFPLHKTDKWRKNAARLRSLDDTLKKIFAKL